MKKFMAALTSLVGMLGMVMMYFSSEFLPVYNIDGEYVLSNQLIRYALYAILACIIAYNIAILLCCDKKKRNARRR